MKRRVFSFLLSIALVISCLSAAAFAAEDEGEAEALPLAGQTAEAETEAELQTEVRDAPPREPAGECTEAAPAYDAEPQGGVCGEGCTWSLSDTGVLTVSGSGPMADYDEGGAPWYAMKSAVTSAVIESGVTSVGANAFAYCSALVSVSLPASVTFIGDYAFCGCGSLSEAALPEGVTAVGEYAFYYCTALTGISVPANTASIGFGAFAYCENLASVTLSYGVAGIGSAAFACCGALGEVIIPTTVKAIGDGAFAYCGALKAITVNAGNTGFQSIDGVLCNKAGTVLLQWPAGKTGKASVPSGVTKVAAYAFAGCEKLNPLIVPLSVKTIGDNAFDKCVGLKDVYYAGTAEECAKLAVGENNGSFSGAGFHYGAVAGGICGSNLKWSVDAEGVLTVSGIGAMREFESVYPGWYNARDLFSSVVIEEGVTGIGDYAFYGCENVISVTLPQSVAAIGRSAFSYCTSLTEVTVPVGVTSVGQYAFYGCSALAEVTVMPGAESVGSNAFGGCSALASVTIPESVTSIAAYAFYGCSALRDVYYGGSEDAWQAVAVASGNTPLTGAALHCNSAVLPDAPAGLTASNKSAGVALEWAAVSKAESYAVLRDGIRIGTAKTAAYTDTTALSGTEYAYTVKAVRGGAFSEASATVKIMFLSVPANVKCVCGAEGITVSWSKVEGAAGYTLYRRVSGSSKWTAVFTSTKATTLSKLDTGVTDGVTYYYTVRANGKSADGNTRYYSSKAATGTKIECSLVSPLEAPTVKSIVNGFSSILVKWSKVEGAEGYYVYRKAEGSGTWSKLKTVKQPASGSTVSFGNTTPKNGEKYTYKVVAYHGTAVSPDSNEKTYMRLTYPALTAVSTTAGKISFSWTDNEYATAFQVEYTTADTFTGATRKTLTSYKTSTAYSGFESGAEYHVRVRAYVKYWSDAEGKYMYYYGTWSSADETGASTRTVTVK